MRIRTALCVALFFAVSASAQELSEPDDFPDVLPGPSAVQPSGGCFLLASGTMSPGDVDWVRVTIPFDSARTIVDVDFSDSVARSFLLVLDNAGGAVFSMGDANNDADDACGIGSGTGVPGSRSDSAADMGATSGGVVLDIGVTGANDFGFTGSHSQQFDYEIWVLAGEATPGCSSDIECDDGVDCTVDVCDLNTGACSNDVDDVFCDNGLFCDGVEVCDAVDDCVPGDLPCGDGAACDEDSESCASGDGPTVDIRPGICPNWINTRSRGFLMVAMMGSSGFDAGEIDPSSLTLWRSDGTGKAVAPWLNRGTRMMDVGIPRANADSCECFGRRRDGIADLVVKFRTGPIVKSMELTELDTAEPIELTLSGRTFDGTAFSASDCIQVVQRRYKGRKRHR